MAVPNKKKLL